MKSLALFVVAIVLLLHARIQAELAGDTLTLAQRVEILKKSTAISRDNLKRYEWIQTTVISVKGEEKSRKMERCFYGADGKLQKVPIEASPEPNKPGGLRGIIREKKQEELTDYMKSAVEMVKDYIPPDPELIQQSKDSGNVTVSITDPGKLIRVNFASYLVPGDSLSIGMNLADNSLTDIRVSSFIKGDWDKKDPVALDVKTSRLKDGTTYPEQVILAASAKDLTAVVSNSGYRQTGG